MGIAYWPNDEKLAAEAMARIERDIAALPAEGVVPVNLDLQQATGTLLAVLPGVMALRSRIAMELPAFDIAQIDKLEDYTLALRFAYATYQRATQPADELKEVWAEALYLRQRLLADVTALSLGNLLDPRTVQALRGTKSIRSIAQDLQILRQALQESWSQIQGKSATTAEDLAAASRIGTRLTRILALREQSPTEERVLLEQLQRVFTLTMRAYDEARAAIAYVRRREGDAEPITPNLYTGTAAYRPTIRTAPRRPISHHRSSGPIPAGVAQVSRSAGGAGELPQSGTRQRRR